MRPRLARFARCAVCTHAALVPRPAAAACPLCGGELREEPAPADLLDGWRCGCYHCVGTPC
jgi:hypothetical protein